jgi:paraquat-inducible protein B
MTFRLCTNESEARFEDSGMTLELVAKNIPTIEVGSPVLHHGVVVGKVRKKNLTENGNAALTIFVKKEFVSTVRQNTRFWRLPATEVQASSGALKVAIASLKTLFEGGIAYDLVGSAGAPVAEGTTFSLFANEELARLNSTPLHLTFENGQGLVEDQTQLRYRGLPVGLVGEIKILPQTVEVTAYLKPEYDFLKNPETTYKVIHSKISLDGATSLETLLSGVYIECLPPRKPRPVVKLIDQIFKAF